MDDRIRGNDNFCLRDRNNFWMCTSFLKRIAISRLYYVVLIIVSVSPPGTGRSKFGP